MGKLRLEPKEKKLQFVVLNSGEPTRLSEHHTTQKKTGSSIRVSCGPFSVEVRETFDARLLGEVLRVVGGCQC